MKKYESFTSDKIRDEIIVVTHENQKFWDFVDDVNWRETTKEGKADYHTDKFVDKGKEVLNKYDKKDQDYFEDVYQMLLGLLEQYLKEIWLSDENEYGPSDDGFWDLRSSIIGYGKEFLLELLKNPEEVFLDMAKNNKYSENFGYIFND